MRTLAHIKRQVVNQKMAICIHQAVVLERGGLRLDTLHALSHHLIDERVDLLISSKLTVSRASYFVGGMRSPGSILQRSRHSCGALTGRRFSTACLERTAMMLSRLVQFGAKFHIGLSFLPQ